MRRLLGLLIMGPCRRGAVVGGWFALVLAVASAQPAGKTGGRGRRVEPGPSVAEQAEAARAGLAEPTAADRALLDEALRRLIAENDRWAYTLTIRPGDGDETVSRYDPSRAPETRWELRRTQGRDATPREVEKWRRDRARQEERRRPLGELLELDAARVAAATAEAIVFDVPLRAEGNERFPPENFQALVTVDRAARVFRSVEVALRQGFRVYGLARVTAAELRIEFAPVAAGYPPLPVRVSGAGSGRIVFVKVGGTFEAERTEFERVEPYRDPFNVEVGPVRVLDF